MSAINSSLVPPDSPTTPRLFSTVIGTKRTRTPVSVARARSISTFPVPSQSLVAPPERMNASRPWSSAAAHLHPRLALPHCAVIPIGLSIGPR